MDTDWLQYVGDPLDLEYNEKVGQADEESLSPSIQVPTPPVSVAWTIILFFFLLNATPKAIS